jgi:hypothetical protein
MNILLTTATITAIATLAAAGIAALPWTERELEQSRDAIEALQQARLPEARLSGTSTGLLRRMGALARG